MVDTKYDAIMLYSGGLDSGATLYYLYRNNVVDLDRLLLVQAWYNQVSWHCETAATHRMLEWYYQMVGKRIDHHILNLGFYSKIGIVGGPGLSTQFVGGTGNVLDPKTIPYRNYLIVLAAMAYAEQGQIPNVYATLGYYDDGGIWDNTPDAVRSLQTFLDEVTTQRQNQNPQLTLPRLIIPSWNKSRRKWVRQEIQAGFPYKRTWSCWFYKGYSPTGNIAPNPDEPCEECPCCESRARVLTFATRKDMG